MYCGTSGGRTPRSSWLAASAQPQVVKFAPRAAPHEHRPPATTSSARGVLKRTPPAARLLPAPSTQLNEGRTVTILLVSRTVDTRLVAAYSRDVGRGSPSSKEIVKRSCGRAERRAVFRPHESRDNPGRRGRRRPHGKKPRRGAAPRPL